MGDYEISAQFQDGKVITYQLPNNSKVSDLIQQIQADKGVTIPTDRTVSVLYLGHFLDPADSFSKIEPNKTFTVNIFFRRPPNSVSFEPGPLASDVRGFDRLRRAGYTDSQIIEFRQNFHNYHHSENQTADERIELEEEWLPALFSGGEDPQFFLPAQNRSARPDRSITLSPLIRNLNVEDSPNTEVPLIQQFENNQSESESWAPFIVGIFFGFLFKFGWYILIPLLIPNRSVLVGYLFGSCFSYLFQEMEK